MRSRSVVSLTKQLNICEVSPLAAARGMDCLAAGYDVLEDALLLPRVEPKRVGLEASSARSGISPGRGRLLQCCRLSSLVGTSLGLNDDATRGGARLGDSVIHLARMTEPLSFQGSARTNHPCAAAFLTASSHAAWATMRQPSSLVRLFAIESGM